MTTKNNALATIDTDEVSLIVNGAPAALEQNSASVQKCTAAGQSLLDTIEAEGMSDALDAECNTFQVRAKKTLEIINDRRKPITQLLDFIKKKFTEQEALVDPKTVGGIYGQVQAKRNAYAQQKQDAHRRAEQEANRRLMVDKEMIRLKADAETQLASYVNGHIFQQAQLLQALFNRLTLQNNEQVKAELGRFTETYDHAHFDKFTPSLQSGFVHPEAIAQIATDTRKGKFGMYSDEFRNAIQKAKYDLLDRVPSRVEELRQIESADASRSAQLKAQAEQRQRDEDARIASEAAERQAAAEREASATAQASFTEALFDSSQAIAAAPQQSAPVIEGWSIEVLHPMGYLQLAQFYFEREGRSETLEKLEKKTLGSMKKFAEAFAKRDGEKITSNYLAYSEVVKAVAKKVTQ